VLLTEDSRMKLEPTATKKPVVKESVDVVREVGDPTDSNVENVQDDITTDVSQVPPVEVDDTTKVDEVILKIEEPSESPVDEVIVDDIESQTPTEDAIVTQPVTSVEDVENDYAKKKEIQEKSILNDVILHLIVNVNSVKATCKKIVSPSRIKYKE